MNSEEILISYMCFEIVLLDISIKINYIFIMIKSFNSKETEKIWNGSFSKEYPDNIQDLARKKLRMLNNSYDLSDLRIPPSNRLEKLKGDRRGQYSIRINNQWRICFIWENNDCYSVEIADYH